MTSEEREIFEFLKSWGTTFVGAKEIARRAGTKQRFHAEPHWAQAILPHMVERGILESDAQGRYRIKPVPRKKREKWVAPDIAKILEEAGIKPPGAANEGDIAHDEYYEGL